jgi:hypothetical protein
MGRRKSGLGALRSGSRSSFSAKSAGSSNSHQRPPGRRNARVSKPAPSTKIRQPGSRRILDRSRSSISRCRATLLAAGPLKRISGAIRERTRSSTKRAANLSPQTGVSLTASAARSAQQ